MSLYGYVSVGISLVSTVSKNNESCSSVNRWGSSAFGLLIRYMGHKHIRYTLYYLHITSQLFPVYREKLDALEKGIGVVYAEE